MQPSRRLREEGGAGRDPILESQVGEPEGGARRMPPGSKRSWDEGRNARLVSLRFSASLALASIATTV